MDNVLSTLFELSLETAVPRRPRLQPTRYPMAGTRSSAERVQTTGELARHALQAALSFTAIGDDPQNVHARLVCL